MSSIKMQFADQKFKDLKQAVSLLENVFNKELLLSSDQVTDLFDVIRDSAAATSSAWKKTPLSIAV